MQAIKNTIAENFGGAHGLAPEEHQFTLEETPDLTGKVAVITGGTEGIGFGCVHTFLTKNISKVFIVSLLKEVFDGAKKSISETISSEAAEKLVWFECDVSDWPKLANVAKKILDSTDRIDILICDAARGIMTYQLTDYGVDRHMATNHFGHCVFTSLLLPLLKKTAKEKSTLVRIANLGSNAHQGTPSDCKFESLDELNQDLGANGQYGRAKLAVMLYSRWLGKKLQETGNEKVLVNSTHPGFVHTKMSIDEIHEPFPIAGYAMSTVLAPVKKDQWDGCVSTVFAAAKTEKTGQYICPPAIPEEGSSMYQDEDLGEALMKLTEKVIKEKSDLDFKFY